MSKFIGNWMRAEHRKAAWRFRDCKAYRKARRVSATISGFVADAKQARRFLISGLVQGVGFRYFAQDAAERLRLGGYVQNLRDGRVEIYAVGTAEQLAKFRVALQRGPSGASVVELLEEHASVDPQYANEFVITFHA